MAIDALSSTLPLTRPAGVDPARAAGAPGTTAPGGAGSFSDSLEGLLTSVDRSAGDANSAIANMVRGTGDVHEAMIALHRAETSLQLTVQVRNKLVQAYQDIMRMPI
jgi:flagellar hook-basal body complex protein FliE